MAACASALSACAHATLDEARAAYAQGDLRLSAQLLADVQPTGDGDKRAIAELSRAVQSDKKKVVDSLLADAGRARGRADEGLQGYKEAIAYYEAALSLLAYEDPQQKIVTASLYKARDTHDARLRAYSGARHKFDEGTNKCGGTQQRDHLAELWALRRACDGTDSLTGLAFKASERCAKAERYDDALQLRSVLDDASRADVSRGAVTYDEWSSEAQAWFALVEIRAGERSLRTATTTTSPTATFGPASSTREEARHRPRGAAKPTVVRNDSPAPAPVVAERPSGRADAVLTRARKLYADGSVFDALLTIDAAMSEDLSDSDRNKLDAQETIWAPDRRRLIDEYLKRGESALREEQTESAYAWYQRILTLDPSHEVAQDRVRRLDRLKAIKGN